MRRSFFCHAVQSRLRSGLHGQNAFHGFGRERPETDGALKGCQEILAAIDAHEGQDFLGMVPSAALRGEQALQEPHRQGTELGEPLAQGLAPPLDIAGREVLRLAALAVSFGHREAGMTGQHFQP